MADEIHIQFQDGEGRDVHGTYKAYGGVGNIIVVTLSSNGRSVRRTIENEPVEDFAMHLLRGLERKRLGKS
jgi:hypothetical protein